MPTLTVPNKFKITPEQFKHLAQVNEETRLELTANGELIIIAPTGGTAGRKNFRLYAPLDRWNEETGLGIGFDSSTVFTLPNGAKRSPDAAWIALERWNALSLEEQDGFPPIAPNFVIELVSPSDLVSQRYEDLQAKMHEYVDNGVQLGWLIEPAQKVVEIYRLGKDKEVLSSPEFLSCEDVLAGFTLDLRRIWK